MGPQQREGLVTLQGKPIVLLGSEVTLGDPAPDFRVVDGEFQPVRLSDFKGQACLLSAVPSLDTGVCALQTKRFNEEMATLPSDVVVMTISQDLPFAQTRFCDAEKIERIRVVSDHVWRAFGLGYGILIMDMGLLARAVFVVSKDGRIAYMQIVPEVTEHPDYDAALAAIRQAAAE